MTRLDAARIGWLADPATQKVMAALKTDDPADDARFVGGAVRNALLGRDADDVDIATPLLPDAVVRRLVAAGLRVVPTGIAHGTVTAVVCGKPFEITSLRRDIATDGRHATVAFGGSWLEDAQRRDFTMNALYASAEGEVFDLVGGLDDLKAGRVRFVGDPATRIREDYLRILRLFRFHAWYGIGRIDDDALAAAVALATGVDELSGERIAKEMLKVLVAPKPVAMLQAMENGGILRHILPGDVDIVRLERLARLDRRFGFAPDEVLRLAALCTDGETVAARWRLPKVFAQRLAAAVNGTVSADLVHAEARKRLFRLGEQTFRDQVFLSWAACEAVGESEDARWFALLELIELFEMPVFPVTGHDARAIGLNGPAVGRSLEAVRSWWIERDFLPGRTELLARLSERVRPAPRA